MDRIIAMYLQSIGYIPSTIYSVSSAAVHAQAVKSVIRKPLLAPSSGEAARSVRIDQLLRVPSWDIDSAEKTIQRYIVSSDVSSHNTKEATPRQTAAALTPLQSLINNMGITSGALSLGTAAISANTAANEHSTADTFIAVGQGVSAGALILGGIGTALSIAAAPELIAAATLVGTLYATAAVVNDAYKWTTASNAVDAALSDGTPGQLALAQSQLLDAKSNFAVDSIGAALGVIGFPSEVAGGVGIGSQVVNLLESAQSGVNGVAVQGLSLLTGLTGLLVTGNGALNSADQAAAESSNAEVPSGADSFGVVNGTASVTYNGIDPLLTPPTGILVNEPTTNTEFTSLAGLDNNYQVIIPVGVSGYDYSQMSVTLYDPIAVLP